MKLTKSNRPANRVRQLPLMLFATFAFSQTGFALEVPSELYVSNGTLFWSSDAPSINVYENGIYIATVHGDNSFTPVINDQSYQLAAHDYGTEFTPLSVPFVVGGSAQLPAYQTPAGIYENDDTLYWTSDAPSINVYENGVYIATLHGESSYGPVFDEHSYQLVAHNNGTGFSELSEIYHVVDEGDEQENEIPYNEARVYLELNDTDGDLGVHALVDGKTWQSVEIRSPEDDVLFSLNVSNGLLAQGMTELFFESHEPTFDDLDPVDFFNRFSEGEYEINGLTVDGEELESDVFLSHIVPAAPTNMMVSHVALPISCEDTDGPAVSSPYVVSWDPVTASHASLGRAGLVTVEKYEVVVEREEPTALKFTAQVEPSVTQLTLPSGLFGTGESIKTEIIAIADTGNQTAGESCFVSAD